MQIQALMPVTQLAGKAIQFLLDPEEALAWLSLDQLSADQQARWLGQCPEFLILAWSRVLADRNPSPMGVSEMVRLLTGSPATSAAENAQVADVICLDSDARKDWTRSLQDMAGPQDLPQIMAGLCELIEQACPELPGSVERWLAPLADAQDCWAEMTAALRCESRIVRLPLDAVFREHDFFSRLQDEKLASMKQLAYGASHEINNPLANIASRAQTLLLDESDPDRRLRLSKINEQAFRAHEMIADMMLFAHPPHPVFELCDPRQVVQTVIDELEPQAQLQQTTLQMRAGQLNPTYVDQTQLAVAVKALVQNGLEALQRSGLIEVSMQDQGDLWPGFAIFVEDNGPGIPSHVATHLFDPFFSGREAGRGLGFGLSKAWRIAQLHGGEISAESPAHGGARFCLRIPYRDAA